MARFSIDSDPGYATLNFASAGVHGSDSDRESPLIGHQKSEYFRQLAEENMPWGGSTSASRPLMGTSSAGDPVYPSRESRGSSFGGADPSAGIRSSIVTLVMSVLGASLLVMPYVCLKCGVVPFVVMLVIMAVVTNFSLRLLTESVKSTSKTSYQAVGKSAFGKTGGVCTTVCIIIQLSGSATAYLAIIGDCLVPIMAHLPDYFPRSVVFWQVLVSCLIIFPLCMLKTLHTLRYTTTLALGLLVLLIVILVVDGAANITTPPVFYSIATDVVWFGAPIDILSVMPVVTCAYMCHQNLFPVSRELERPTGRRVARVTSRAMAICAAVYSLCGVGGYFTFLKKTEGNVLVSYHDHADGIVPMPIVSVALYGIGAALVLSYPVGIAFELRKGLRRLLFPKMRRFSWMVHTSLNIVVIGVTTTIAILVPNAETLFALTGASTSTLLVFGLPGLFYLRTSSRSIAARKPGMNPSRARDLGALLLMLLGFVLVPLSLGVIIAHMLNPHDA